MAHKGTISESQARLEHKMAVNRDYIFQPRMCKYYICQVLLHVIMKLSLNCPHS